MIDYVETVYRPPSEASSLILQLTIGCSHNACTFCDMYKNKKFYSKNWDEFTEHVEYLAGFHPRPDKIFLADGNCLAVDTDMLLRVMKYLKDKFPSVKRITSYAGPKDILSKTPEELKAIKLAGLDMVYMGVESGNDEILKKICKGVHPDEMVTAGQRVVQSGIKLSVTVISGIGGKEFWREHALDSAKVVNAINPEYLGLLTLMVRPGTRMFKEVSEGKFHLLEASEVAEETLLFIENLDLDSCVFRSNHVSNYLSLAGTFPKDKEKLLASIRSVLKRDTDKLYRPEFLRHL